MTDPFYTRHRGPYLLCVTRPMLRKENTFQTEWLLERVLTGEEIESEALALLADPRDTITGIDIWSDREECFVMSYKKGAA